MAINHCFPREESASCEEACDATSNSIVFLLQNKFLKLLASLKIHDRKNTGYIDKEDFKNIVRKLLKCEKKQLEDLVELLCHDSEGPLSRVPYPKFLAMFETKQRKEREFSGRPLVQCRVTRRSLPRVQSAVNAQLLEQVATLVLCDLPSITQHFVEIDEQNRGSLTFSQTLDLFKKCGVSASEDDLLPLWETFLKNKDGTVNFHQLIKELSQLTNVNKTETPIMRKRHTDDHCFMRSRKLHRDEDMLMDTLRYKIVYYREALLEHLSSRDQEKCGYVTLETFQKLLQELCPAFTEPEIDLIAAKCQDDSHPGINYYKMFSLAIPSFRPPEHVEGLLPQLREDVVKVPCTVLPLAAKPNHGLPGVKGYLQKQLTKKWKEMRRLFKTSDTCGTGHVPVTHFKKVLEHCNIRLSSEQLYQILEKLDPNLSGKVNYAVFLNVVFES